MSVDTTRGGSPVALTPAEKSQKIRFTRDEVPRLVAMFGFVAALHVVGWGLFVHYNSIPRLHTLTRQRRHDAGLRRGRALAYTLGLRHAFDADHISAIDDTTRYLLQKGKKPLGRGLFFSLGPLHGRVPFVTALALVASQATASSRPSRHRRDHRHAGVGRCSCT